MECGCIRGDVRRRDPSCRYKQLGTAREGQTFRCVRLISVTMATGKQVDTIGLRPTKHKPVFAHLVPSAPHCGERAACRIAVHIGSFDRTVPDSMGWMRRFPPVARFPRKHDTKKIGRGSTGGVIKVDETGKEMADLKKPCGRDSRFSPKRRCS